MNALEKAIAEGFEKKDKEETSDDDSLDIVASDLMSALESKNPKKIARVLKALKRL